MPKAPGIFDHVIQHVNAQGTPVATIPLLSQTPHIWPSFLPHRRMVSDGAGGFFICWVDSNRALQVQHFTSPGAGSSWSPGALAHPIAYSLASDEHHGALVSWVEQDPQRKFVLHAQRIDASGRSLWINTPTTRGLLFEPPPLVSTFRDLPAYWTSIVADGRGGAMLIWTEHTTDSPSFAPGVRTDVRTLCLSPQGLATSDVQLVSSGTGISFRTLAAADGTSGAIEAWTHSSVEDGTSQSEVGAQRVKCCPPSALEILCRVSDAHLIAGYGPQGCRFGVSFPCVRDGILIGAVPVPRLCHIIGGIVCPGCLQYRDARCADWVRMYFAGMAYDFRIELHTIKGQKVGEAHPLARSRRREVPPEERFCGFAKVLTFRPDRREEYVLVFQSREKARYNEVFPVQSFIESGDGEPPDPAMKGS